MKNLLYIGEPPTVNTGFGTVSKGILPYLAKEFKVTAFCVGGYGKDCLTEIGKYGVTDAIITEPDNPHSLHMVDGILKQQQPDVIFIYKDTGSVWEFIDKSHLSFYPIAAYTVTEGAPIMDAWMRLYNDHIYKKGFSRQNYTIEEPIVASQFDADTIRLQCDREVTVGYHGVDHANWRKYSRIERDELRKQLGNQLQTDLTDYSLLLYVARNSERKQWPRLFEIAKYIKDTRPDLKFKIMAHTKKFDMFKEGGWIMTEIIQRKGLDGDDVIFFDRSDVGGTTFDSEPGKSDPSMSKYYNMADLYVSVSGAEACGLPMLEAARCGLPVLCTEYAGGWEYVKQFAVPLKIQTFQTDRTGLEWALVDVKDTGDKIIQMLSNPSLHAQHSDKGLKYCNYRWADLGNKCLAAAHNALEKYKWNIKIN